MLRAMAWTLLVVSFVVGSLQAQRTGQGFRGSSSGPSARSTFAGPSHAGSGFPRRGAFSRERRGHPYRPFLYSYYSPYDYYDEANDSDRSSTVVNVEREKPASNVPASQVPIPKAQVIDIPIAANSAAGKPLPLTVFVLANGERLETAQFLLTAADLSVNNHRRQRTIPLDQLDLDATILANRQRGIELRVPANQNEMLLRF